MAVPILPTTGILSTPFFAINPTPKYFTAKIILRVN
jgi:hypothetical protein